MLGYYMKPFTCHLHFQYDANITILFIYLQNQKRMSQEGQMIKEGKQVAKSAYLLLDKIKKKRERAEERAEQGLKEDQSPKKQMEISQNPGLYINEILVNCFNDEIMVLECKQKTQHLSEVEKMRSLKEVIIEDIVKKRLQMREIRSQLARYQQYGDHQCISEDKINIQELEKSIKKWSEQCQMKKGQFQNISENMIVKDKQFEKQKSKLRLQIYDLQQLNKELMKKDKFKVTEEMIDKQRQIVKRQSQIRQLKIKVDSFSKDKDNLEHLLKIHEKQRQERDVEMKSTKLKMRKFEEVQCQLRTESEQNRKVIDKRNEVIKQFESQIANSNKEVKRQLTELQLISKDNNIKSKQINQLKVKIDNLTAQLKLIKQSSHQKNQEHSELTKEIFAKTEELVKIKSLYSQQLGKNEQIFQDLQFKSAQYKDLLSQKNDLSLKNQVLSQQCKEKTQSYSTIERMMKQKDQSLELLNIKLQENKVQGQNVQSLKIQRDDLKKQIEQVLINSKHLQEKLNNYDQEISTLKQQLQAKQQQKILSTTTQTNHKVQISKLNKECQVLQCTLHQTQEKNKRLQSIVNNWEQKYDQQIKKQSKLRSSLIELQEQIQQLKNQRENDKNKIQNMKNETQIELDRIKSAESLLKQQISSLKDHKFEKEKEHQKLKVQNNAKSLQISSLNSTILELTKKFKEIKDLHDGKENQYQQFKETNDSLEGLVESLQEKIEQEVSIKLVLQKHNKDLTLEVKTLKESQLRQVGSLKQQIKEGLLKGQESDKKLGEYIKQIESLKETLLGLEQAMTLSEITKSNLEEEVKTLKKRIKQILEESTKQANGCINMMKQEQQKQIKMLRDQVEQEIKSHRMLKEQYTEQNKLFKQLNREHIELKIIYEKVKQESKSLQSQINEKNVTIKAKNQEIDSLAQIQKEFDSFNTNCSSQLESLFAQIDSWKEKYSLLQTELSKAEQKIAEVLTIQKINQNSKDAQFEQNKINAKYIKSIEQLSKELSSSYDQIKELYEQISQMKEQREDLKAKLKQFQGKARSPSKGKSSFLSGLFNK